MTALFYIGFLASVLLAFVALTVFLQFAERRWPAFSRFLDRHVGEEPAEWRRW